MVFVSLKHTVLVFAVAFFAAVASLYMLVSHFWSSAFSGKVALADECSEESVQKENPNKMLFISCGGFLE